MLVLRLFFVAAYVIMWAFDMEALNNGTEAYDKGDYEAAVEYYRAAAMCGVNFFALNKLGVCYEDGVGVEQDYEKAVEYYRKSAEQGNDWAEYNLAGCYYNGCGVKKNRAKAKELYRSAAEKGNKNAKEKFVKLF